MNAKSSYTAKIRLDERHKSICEQEYPDWMAGDLRATYLNTGSVGRKPTSVLEAISKGWRAFNVNPTRMTFIEKEILEEARQAAGQLLGVESESLLFVDNTTHGLQLILGSFLKKPVDELLTTDREHKSVDTILRYLEDTRGVKVRRLNVENDMTSEQFCMSLLNRISPDTRLILVSEVDCHTGWRPDLTLLSESLKLLELPLLVDGAHAPGNGPCRPDRYPLWVGAGHKWLGGPNGIAMVRAEHELIPLLEPVNLGDGFYRYRDAEIYDLRRFECTGTSDVVKFFGLTAAIKLFAGLDQAHIDEYQNYLVSYLKESLLAKLPVTFRSPGFDMPEGERQAS
ncbi:MAG: aminotransferase class V-fold PLP-dependent enzyme, partial [Anaerolineae bacterium]|nr:aminotransferase class V-fold PLP-dependent enzyme [Anaerolineae bacterium]